MSANPALSDPVEDMFDKIQPVLDENIGDVASWSDLDVKRFATLVKTYLQSAIHEQQSHQPAKRERPEDDSDEGKDEHHHHHEHGEGCCGGHHSEGSGQRDNANADDGAIVRERVCETMFRSLQRIRKDLRRRVQFGAIEEDIHPPKHNPSFDPNIPAVDVDAFLYDQQDIDDFVDQKLLSRHYCIDCKSTQIGDVQFLSHSFSKEQLVYLFCYAIPFACRNKHQSAAALSLCDVGSRYGIVLAAASAISNIPANTRSAYCTFSKAVGLEWNKQLCSVQQQLFSSPTRSPTVVEVKCMDAMSDAGLAEIRSSDVVVLHNVFEWFQDESKQLDVWIRLRKVLSRPGQMIVAVPLLEQSINHLAQHFGKKHKPNGTDGGDIHDVHDADTFIQKWVEKLDLTSSIELFANERLSCAEEDPCAEEDTDEKEAREEALELISLINIYVVR